MGNIYYATGSGTASIYGLAWYNSYNQKPLDTFWDNRTNQKIYFDLAGIPSNIGALRFYIKIKDVTKNTSHRVVSNKGIVLYSSVNSIKETSLPVGFSGYKTFTIKDKAFINDFIAKKYTTLKTHADINGILTNDETKGDTGMISGSFYIDASTYVEVLSEYDLVAKAPNGINYVAGDSMPFSWQFDTTIEGVTQSGFELYASRNGGQFSKIAENLNSNSNSYSYNSNALEQGNYRWKVKIYTTNGTSLESNILTFNIVGKPAVSNIELNQFNIDDPFVLSWRSSYQTSYEIEVYQNNVKIRSYSADTTTPNRTIPVGEITKVGSTSFRVRISNTFSGVTAWSGWEERNFTLTRTIPRITNFNVLDNFFEKDIRTNWRGENQARYEFEILKENNVIKQFTGNSENNFTIPAGALASGGDYTFRVRPIYVPTWSNTDLSYGEWVERNVKLMDIVPTVSNLALSGSNIDLSLTFSWDSSDQNKYDVEVYKDNTRVDSRSGASEKTFTYPHGTFTVGLHKFKVRVAYTGASGDRWTDWKEVSVTLTETLPSIGVLEPDGVIVDRDNPIRLWWTSLNQSKWKLIVDDSLTYQGDTQTEYVLSAGVLQTGTHKMILTVTYVTPNNVEKTVSKKAEFIVQGKPPIPTITSLDVFDVSRPSVVWDSSDQQGYILEILKDSHLVYTTDWQNGLINTHMIMDYLGNGVYVARVKIINQFGMESDWGSKAISINANEDTVILLESEVKENATRLIWNNVSDTFNKFYIIRNGVVIANVYGTEYTDYTCNNECIYTVRGINSRDIYKDSNSINVNCMIKKSVVATIDNLDDMMDIGISRNENQFGANIGLEHELIYLSGREHPVSVFGEHSTDTYSFKFNTRVDLFRFLDMCRRRQVFCYRDKRQTLYLTISNPSYSVDKFGMEHSIQATQIDYSEVVAYD